MPALLPNNASPDLRGSALASKEPYHVPGYAGYKPQFKYQCSETFGNSTHRLLTSSDVRKSNNSVLKAIDPPRSKTVPLRMHDVPKIDRDEYQINEILRNRHHKYADQLYTADMKSNYMGFVPKAHFSSYHARTFPEICNVALKDFTEEQLRHKSKLDTLHQTMQLQESRNLNSSQRNLLETSRELPLYSIRTSLPPYVSSSAYERHESPYFLPDEHPQKHFRAGFAGHVPFYKDLGGHGYPIVTNQALKEFSKERDRNKTIVNQPISLKSVTETRPPLKSISFSGSPSKQQIFLLENGMLPRYAGYVPGQKFRFGQTFGLSTQDPLQLKVATSKPLALTS